MAGNEASFPRAVGGAEKRSRTAEQAPHVWAQGCASSARLPFGEHRREGEATRCCRTLRHRRNGLWLLSAETESSPRRGTARKKTGMSCGITRGTVPSPGATRHRC